MGDLENRVVIITGGARGIGYGIAEAVADQGACVVIADILEDEAKESAKKLLALADEKDAMMVYGHDSDQWRTLRKAPAAYYS